MNIYKFDTHIHTCETSRCGKIPGKQIAWLYKNAGYDGIVVTDHYHQEYFDSLGDVEWRQKADKFLEGYRICRYEGQKLGLQVLLGMEIRFQENGNDYLVFGFDETFIRNNESLYTLGLKNFRKMVKRQGMVIIQAHPCRVGMSLANPSLLDGVEVYNGNKRHDSHNSLAREFAKKHGLKMTSGSDTHQIEDLARGGIMLPEVPAHCAELAEMIHTDKIRGLIAAI